MGSKKVVDVLMGANSLLNDYDVERWPLADLLNWYNDAQRAIVVRRPDASTTTDQFTCQRRALQHLPISGIRLIDVIQNHFSGRVITLMDVNVLDQHDREWRNSEGKGKNEDIEHYTYDDRLPKEFYLYPVPTAGHIIEVSYTVLPQEVVIGDFSTDDQSIELDDVYVNPLIDYIVYKALIKDSEHSANMQVAGSMFNSFKVGLGEKLEADGASSPTMKGAN